MNGTKGLCKVNKIPKIQKKITSAMLFAPVHGGCYIIFSVGNGYSCGMSVMWCVLSEYLRY